MRNRMIDMEGIKQRENGSGKNSSMDALFHETPVLMKAPSLDVNDFFIVPIAVA